MFYLLTEEGGAAPSSLTTWGTLGMLVIMAVVFYFFIIRPQKKQEKEMQDMRNSVEIDDEITTIGGIIGKVISIKDDTLVIETTKERTKIRILKSAIRSIDVKASDNE